MHIHGNLNMGPNSRYYAELVRPKRFQRSLGGLSEALQNWLRSGEASNKITRKRTGFAAATERYCGCQSARIGSSGSCPAGFWPCGAMAVGRDGCPATTEILMTKTKAKRSAATKRAASKLAATRSVNAKRVGTKTTRSAASKGVPAAGAALLPTKAPGARANSKQAQVLALLRSIDGCTIEGIMKVTGWQQHSVRGFFAGVIRKKLKLDLVSERVDDVRHYRIKPPADSVSKSAKAA